MWRGEWIEATLMLAPIQSNPIRSSHQLQCKKVKRWWEMWFYSVILATADDLLSFKMLCTSKNISLTSVRWQNKYRFARDAAKPMLDNLSGNFISHFWALLLSSLLVRMQNAWCPPTMLFYEHLSEEFSVWTMQNCTKA